MNVIIGSGVAAVRAAGAMRAAGYEGPIVMVGAERDLPYQKPPLSKELLLGRLSPGEIAIEPASFYAENRIELLLGGRAVKLDAASRRVELEGGATVAFERLLIATGAQPRRLEVRGATLPNILHLRTLDDARGLGEKLGRASRVLVVGAGLIGLEVAAAARLAGKDVTVLERGDSPLRRLLPDERVGASILALHRDHGVEIRTAATMQAFLGGDRVEEVVLADDRRLAADLVVVAVGVRPSTDWLAGSGLALDDGVLANESTETNIAGIHAAGDVARIYNARYGRHLRSEQWGNAHDQGVVAGRRMAGVPASHAAIPFASSEQFGVRLQFAGLPDGADRTVVRGDVASRSFIAFLLRERELVAAFAMNRAREMMQVRKLIAKGARLEDERALGDPGSPLPASA